MEAHQRQHWKALGQARNLVKRVYVPRDVAQGRWDRGPRAHTNVYEYVCECCCVYVYVYVYEYQTLHKAVGTEARKPIQKLLKTV